MINNMNSLRHPKNLIEEAKQMNTHRNYNEKELASVESQPKINLAQEGPTPNKILTEQNYCTMLIKGGICIAQTNT